MLPHGGASELAETLVVEAEHHGDVATLVVAPQQRDFAGVADLQRQQQQESLDTVHAPVHVVTHEQVVSLGYISAHYEQLLQVVHLPVDVAADLSQKYCRIRISHNHPK